MTARTRVPRRCTGEIDGGEVVHNGDTCPIHERMNIARATLESIRQWREGNSESPLRLVRSFRAGA